MAKRHGRTARKLLLPLLAAVAAAALLLSPWGEPLRTRAGRAAAMASLDRAVRDAGPLAPLLYVGASAAGMCLLPATPFLALGAILFGKAGGSALGYVSALLAASASFLLGRHLFREAARDVLAGRLPRLEQGAREHGFRVILLMRLLWFPFIVLNWGAGATSVTFRDYIAATALGVAAPMVTATWLLGSARELVGHWKGIGDLARFDILFPLSLLAVSVLLPLYFERRRKAALRALAARTAPAPAGDGGADGGA